MSRSSLIRRGAVAIVVLSLSVPAHALPFAKTGSFGPSLQELWNRITAPLTALWATTDSRGTCDPNGGAICS